MARYDSFLLRIWRSIGDGGPQWAIRLENLQHDDRRHFTSLEALLAHLRAIAGPLATTPAETRRDGASNGEQSNSSQPFEPDSP